MPPLCTKEMLEQGLACRGFELSRILPTGSLDLGIHCTGNLLLDAAGFVEWGIALKMREISLMGHNKRPKGHIARHSYPLP